MSRLRASRRILVTSVVVVAMSASIFGVAVAYWSATGSGTGSATAGATLPVTVSRGTLTAAIYPGGTSGVALTITNPNTSPVQIASLALDTAGTGGFSVDTAHSGCALTIASTALLTFTTQTPASGWTVPAKIGTANGSLPVTLVDSPTNPVLAMNRDAANACQGASFGIVLRVAP